jgi:hypothetical protein
MAKHFSPDFYVTCATVIPVLFLALAVQGRTYESVLRSLEQANTPPESAIVATISVAGVWKLIKAVPHKSWLWRSALALFRNAGQWLLLFLIVLAGGYGEGMALFVLYRGSETADERRSVFIATLGVLAVVVAIPSLAFLRANWSDINSPRPAPDDLEIVIGQPDKAEQTAEEPPDDGTAERSES